VKVELEEMLGAMMMRTGANFVVNYPSFDFTLLNVSIILYFGNIQFM